MKFMGLDLEKWQESSAGNKEAAATGFECGNCRDIFQIFTKTLLSLLLPLSFLLLARLSTAHYLLAVAGNPSRAWSELVSFVFLYGNSTILYVLLSLVSVAAFVHVLSGRVTFFNHSSEPDPFRPRLYAAWILLCTLQVCVGLGIEGSIAAGIDGSGFSRDTSLLSKVIFFLGLHETMRFWSRSVVKPVVDDTVMGCCAKEEERWVERVAMAVSFGFLWWWRLRDEIDSLVVVAELKRELPEGVAMVDFIGWWLYYLTVSIGLIRIFKSVISLGVVTLLRKVEGGNFSCNSQAIYEKV